jgi:hypothetical protein
MNALKLPVAPRVWRLSEGVYEIDIEDECFEVTVTSQFTPIKDYGYYGRQLLTDCDKWQVFRDGKPVELPPEIDALIFEDIQERVIEDYLDDDNYGEF